MGNFFGADIESSRLREGDHRERDPRYAARNKCLYCGEWIRDNAKTCKSHKSRYDTNVRYPAKRLHSLLTRLESLPGDQVAVNQSELLSLIRWAEAEQWRAFYNRLASILERVE